MHRENDAIIGPSVSTEYLAVYDLEKGTISQKVDVETEAYIVNAAWFQEGIVYVDYENPLDKTTWSILRRDDSGTHLIAQGNARSWMAVPHLAVLENRLLFLWEDPDAGSIGIYEITGSTYSELFSVERFSLYSTEFYHNGQEFCFMAGRPEAEFATIFVGNADGIQYQYDLSHKLTSYAISNHAVLVGLGDEKTKEFFALNLDLDTYEASLFKVYRPLYRMTAGQSETALCVDDRFDFYEIVPEEGRIRQLDMPSDSYFFQVATVAISPAVNQRYLVHFETREDGWQLYFLNGRKL